MSKKIIITLVTLMMIVGLTSACSSDDKDNKKDDTKSESKKSSSISLKEFQKDYKKACDKVDQDIINALDDADFETITSDELQEAYDNLVEEFDKNAKDLEKLDVPSKFEDDWDRYLEINQDLADRAENLIKVLIELIDVKDEYVKASSAGDTEKATELNQQLTELQDEVRKTTDAGEDLESERDDLRDTLGIDSCTK